MIFVMKAQEGDVDVYFFIIIFCLNYSNTSICLSDKDTIMKVFKIHKPTLSKDTNTEMIYILESIL